MISIKKSEPNDPALIIAWCSVVYFLSFFLIPTIPIRPEPKSQVPNAKDLASLVSKNGYFLFETARGIVTITYKDTDMAHLRKRLKNDSDLLFFCNHIYNIVVSPEAIEG